LRSKGILPPKKEKEITEEDVINLVEQTVREKQNGKFEMKSLNFISDIYIF